MIKKGTKYSAYFIDGGDNKIYQGIFEIRTLTEKTCKLTQVEEGFFDYMILKKNKKGEKNVNLKSKNNMKDTIKETFIKYRGDCGSPIIFEIIGEN